MKRQKNTHLFHIEEEVLNSGFSGGILAIKVLTNILRDLEGKHTGKNSVTLTHKWDGAMSIVTGTDPETNKFFVATKSALNVTPKLNFTDEDIQKNYSDKPQVEQILKVALREFPKLGIVGVVQGDVMFLPKTIRRQIVDGESLILFRPNTITYGVYENSATAASILRAEIGVIFHTKYTGDKIRDMKASFDLDVSKFNRIPEVWFDNATISDITTITRFSKQESREIRVLLDKANSVLLKSVPVLKKLTSSKTTVDNIKKFQNKLIRQGKIMGLEDIENLIKFIEDQYKSEGKRYQIKSFFDSNKRELRALFYFQSIIAQVKILILKKLHQLNYIKTFLERGKSYSSTNPEGFVAIQNKTGRVVKLVDRLSFSRANFYRHSQSIL